MKSHGGNPFAAGFFYFGFFCEYSSAKFDLDNFLTLVNYVTFKPDPNQKRHANYKQFSKITEKHFHVNKIVHKQSVWNLSFMGCTLAINEMIFFPTYQLINYPRSTHRFYPHEQYLHHHIQSEYRNIFLIKLSERFYIRFIVQMKMFISHCLSLS